MIAAPKRLRRTANREQSDEFHLFHSLRDNLMKLANTRMITPHPVCRSLSCVLITACILLAFLFSARAFFPTNRLTVGTLLGTSHAKMTDQAITELGQEFLGINNLTNSMKKAMVKIDDANAFALLFSG